MTIQTHLLLVWLIVVAVLSILFNFLPPNDGALGLLPFIILRGLIELTSLICLFTGPILLVVPPMDAPEGAPGRLPVVPSDPRRSENSSSSESSSIRADSLVEQRKTAFCIALLCCCAPFRRQSNETEEREEGGIEYPLLLIPPFLLFLSPSLRGEERRQVI